VGKSSAKSLAPSEKGASSSHTDVPETNGSDLASCDGFLLASLEVVALEATVEIGSPLEGVLCETLVERTSHLCVSVQSLVFNTPLR
jgi:hypothetical protein